MFVQVQRLRGPSVVEVYDREFSTPREYQDFVEPLEREARRAGDTVRTVAQGAPLCFTWSVSEEDEEQ